MRRHRGGPNPLEVEEQYVLLEKRTTNAVGYEITD